MRKTFTSLEELEFVSVFDVIISTKLNMQELSKPRTCTN